MTLKEVEFAELMCARFCHDLSGAIGAVSNSTDFLDSKNKDLRAKALELVKFSSNQAISRVNYFRRAYGFVPSTMDSNLMDVKFLIVAFLDGTKHDIIWDQSWQLININSNLEKLILNSV